MALCEHIYTFWPVNNTQNLFKLVLIAYNFIYGVKYQEIMDFSSFLHNYNKLIPLSTF